MIDAFEKLRLEFHEGVLTQEQINCFAALSSGQRDKVVAAWKTCKRKACILSAWQTIDIGTFPYPSSGLIMQVERSSGCVSEHARALFLDPRSFPPRYYPRKVQLVRVHLREIGIKEYVGYKETLAAAEECGLRLCPAETALQLRVQYNDQPEGEVLWVGTPLLKQCESSPGGLFSVLRRDGVSWLDGLASITGHHWSADEEFVFVRPPQ